MPEPDDWRRKGQENYLSGAILSLQKYTKQSSTWEHDHCEFCGVKFMEKEQKDVQTEGYVSNDGYRWVCKTCFEDFKSEYNWNINEESA
jgi:hypothetical protein